MAMGFAIMVLLCFAVSITTIVTNGEECAKNKCPDNENCFQRNVPGEPDYVCECRKPAFMGYNCLKTSNTKVIKTCYGEDCVTGNFSSPNYPDGIYGNSEAILVLLYIPRATEIQFSFAPLFFLERNADELFVGSGLVIPYRSLPQENELRPRLFYFSTIGQPDPFTVYNDTAFIYFISDRYTSFNGFQIFWNASVADPPPPTTTEAATRTGMLTTVDGSTVDGSAAKAIIFQTCLATTIFTVSVCVLSRLLL